MKGDHPIHATPSDVCAERGVVILDGPGNLAIAMTVEAAEETARLLLEAVRVARTQDPMAS